MMKFKFNPDGEMLHTKTYVMILTWMHGDADLYEEKTYEFEEGSYDWMMRTVEYLWHAPRDTAELFEEALKYFDEDEWGDPDMAFDPPYDAKFEMYFASLNNIKLYKRTDNGYVQMVKINGI